MAVVTILQPEPPTTLITIGSVMQNKQDPRELILISLLTRDKSSFDGVSLSNLDLGVYTYSQNTAQWKPFIGKVVLEQ